MVVHKIISDQAPMAEQNQAERWGKERVSLNTHSYSLTLSAEPRPQQSSWTLEKPEERCHSKTAPEGGRGLIPLTRK